MTKLLNALVFLIPLSLAAQEEVVFKKVTVHGGFGGPFVELTSIENQSGFLAGGGGGIILNSFFVGGFGQGGNFAMHSVNGNEYPLDFGFGGLWLGFTAPTLKSVHFYSSLKIGGGTISLTPKGGNSENPFYDDGVFVVQPEAGVEVNFFKWFRLALTANYRLVTGVTPNNAGMLHNRDFNAAGMGLTFRFGKFYRGEANQ